MTGRVGCPKFARGARLVALFLAVLLLISSLPGHATMGDCAIDCGTGQATSRILIISDTR